MSTLQKQVIQSLDGLSDDHLSFLLDMIEGFMKPAQVNEKNFHNSVTTKNSLGRIGSLEGMDLIDEDYNIDECNDEIAEIFRGIDR